MTNTKPPDQLFKTGIDLFNAHEFFACHEILEELWQGLSGDEKRFTQAIIQIAVAYHHLERGNGAGAGRLLARALDKLDPAARQCRLAGSFNTAQLLDHVRKQHAYLTSLPDGELLDPVQIIPPVLGS